MYETKQNPSLKSAATKKCDRMETGNPMVEFPMGRILGVLPVQKACWCLLERLYCPIAQGSLAASLYAFMKKGGIFLHKTV